MTIGLFINEKNPLSVSVGEKFIKMLEREKAVFFNVKKSPDLKCDVLVVFGGDGTVIRALDYAVRFDVPVLCVNTGTLGFLSDFSPEQLDLVYNLLQGEIKYEERVLMEVEYNGEKALCLNDAVILRKPETHLVSEVIKLNVFLNGERVDKFFADGIIFSTPTGSTAYSLSAGGAVLTPETKAFIITPICSHSFLSRPVVYSDDSQVTVNKADECQAVCYTDGKFFCELDGDLIIKKSEKSFKLFKLKKEFFVKLSRKLNRTLGE